MVASLVADTGYKQVVASVARTVVASLELVQGRIVAVVVLVVELVAE